MEKTAGYSRIQIHKFCPVVQYCRQSCLLFIYKNTHVDTTLQRLHASGKNAATVAVVPTANNRLKEYTWKITINRGGIQSSECDGWVMLFNNRIWIKLNYGLTGLITMKKYVCIHVHRIKG